MPHDVSWLGVTDGWHFLFTLLIAGIGGALGVGLRIPAGALLLPMVIGAVLESTGLVRITLPQLLLAASYTFLGWSIGLGFTRDILRHASRVFPHVLVSVLILMGICGALAYLLVLVAGIDPLTAYLATSPGGIDSVAIIGASSNVDLSFVMAMQTARVVIVLIAGPPLARLIARRVRAEAYLPPPRGGRIERHGLSPPGTIALRIHNGRAKCDGVLGGGEGAARRRTPPPGAPRSLSPSGVPAWIASRLRPGLSDGAPPSPLEGGGK